MSWSKQPATTASMLCTSSPIGEEPSSQASTENLPRLPLRQASGRRGRQEAEILRRICNRLAEDMGVFFVPVRENTGPLHAGADALPGTAVSHNGKRQGTASVSQPVHHRPAFEKRQEKACPEGEKRDKAGEAP